MFFEFHKKSKLERLYDKYSKTMYIEAYRILNDAALSEDAVAEAFTRIMNHLHKLDERNSRKTLGYLLTVCKNVSLDIKAKQDKELPAEEFEFYSHSKYETTDMLVIEKENFESLKALIKSLKPIYYDVLQLKYVYELQNCEIAEALGISEEAVRTRLSRAKKELKEKIERREKDEKEFQ